MSAEQIALPSPGVRADPRQVAILRYAFGVAIATTVSLGVAWPVSYLTPLLTAVFLAPPGRPIPFKAGVGLVFMVAVACLFAMVFSAALLPYPIAYVLLMGWLLATIFYASASGAQPMFILWLLLALMLIPLLTIQSGELASSISQYLVLGAAAAVLFVWIAHAFFPPPPEPPTAAPATESAAPARPSQSERVRSALLSTVVVFPVVLLFTFFQLTGQLIVLVFVALLALNPSLQAGKQAGIGIIAANVAGGIVSILFYNLLVAVPWFPFLIVLTLLCGLLFGSFLFSDHKYAKLAGSGFTTVLLIIGSTTTSTDEAGGAVLARVLQITAAVLWIVIAFNVIENLGRRRRSPDAESVP